MDCVLSTASRGLLLFPDERCLRYVFMKHGEIVVEPLDQKAIGRRIQNLRSSLGWTQPGMGTKMGNESPASISNWESGNRLIQTENLHKLCKIVGVTPEEILYGTRSSFHEGGGTMDEASLSHLFSTEEAQRLTPAERY